MSKNVSIQPCARAQWQGIPVQYTKSLEGNACASTQEAEQCLHGGLCCEPITSRLSATKPCCQDQAWELSDGVTLAVYGPPHLLSHMDFIY